MEHYICSGECDDRSSTCDEESPWGDYACTREAGHSGPHVACSSEECNLAEWVNKNDKKHVSLKKEAGPIGPIVITVGAVEVAISPEGTRVSAASLPDVLLTPDDLKRLIRALTMAANVQRGPIDEECSDCSGDGYYLNDDSNFPIQRCDHCEQFASDYEAWLSLIPDETRLSRDDEEEE